MLVLSITLLSLAAGGHALPRTSSRNLLAERQEDPEICTYPRGDPSALRASGSDQYLSDFLTSAEDQAWSTANWLSKLDEKTTQTADGGPYHSTLNCTQLEDRAHCQIPDQDVQCRWFTPPEVYWIRLWAPNVQTFFDAARNSLVEETLVQSLSVNQLTEDFDLGDLDKEDPNPFIAAIAYMIAPLLSFSGAAKGLLNSRPGAGGTNTRAGMVPEVGTVLGNIAESIAGGANLVGFLNSKGKQAPPTPRQLANVVEEVYRDFFNAARSNIKLTNQQFFSGIGEGQPDLVTSFSRSLSKAGATVNGRLHPVASILGSGEFASGGSGNLAEVLQAGYKMAKDQMIGAILGAQGVVLFGNTKSSEGDCQGPVAWWNNDVCYKFKRVKVEGDGVLSSQDVDEELLKRIPEKYSIKVEDMMENIRRCRNSFARTPDPDVSLQTAYPTCHFGMAYFAAEDEPCKMWPGPFGLEHAGCSDSYESLYWQRYTNGEEVPRQGSYPDATLPVWMIPFI